MFKILKKSKKSRGRIGSLKTSHGVIKTPFFMPIATRGAVKTITASELQNLGAQIVLSNTYHLLLKPGVETMRKAGGLHNFMGWPGPILTDSGGYQVFSLSQMRKITQEGVEFRDPQTGAKYQLTPKKVLEIQEAIGSDIRMLLDVCTPYPCTRKEAERAVELTTLWAKKSQKTKKQPLDSARGEESKKANCAFFAIVQGSIYKDLRLRSTKQLVKLNFDGYAVGGLAVGEGTKKMLKVLDYTVPELPEEKPRYLMGVGRPEEIVEAVKRGVDMFDCVIPTREARHGRLYLWSNPSASLNRVPLGSTSVPRTQSRLDAERSTPRRGSSGRERDRSLGVSNTYQFSRDFYKTINIANAKFAKDFSPINHESKVPELKNLTKAYLHHLFRVKEQLGQRLATLNNVEFYLGLMEWIREGIRKGEL